MPLIAVLLLLLLLCSRTTLHISFSVILHISLCIFLHKSSPFFPVFGNIDPDVVVLTLSFKCFLILFFVKVLFEEIVDVIFPSFPWSTDRSVGPIS